VDSGEKNSNTNRASPPDARLCAATEKQGGGGGDFYRRNSHPANLDDRPSAGPAPWECRASTRQNNKQFRAKGWGSLPHEGKTLACEHRKKIQTRAPSQGDPSDFHRPLPPPSRSIFAVEPRRKHGLTRKPLPATYEFAFGRGRRGRRENGQQVLGYDCFGPQTLGWPGRRSLRPLLIAVVQEI